ncbi:MAG: hypothetical protein ILA06_04990 [Bacteroidaceae bacterium]|nr:hypothetical protein [Bacteroidaceae bacterium]
MLVLAVLTALASAQIDERPADPEANAAARELYRYLRDAYVDIVARDGYPENNTSHVSQAADFRRLRQAHPNKMTAMPECNSVPSWENMQRDQALWLMVAPWCGGAAFDHGNTAEFWRQFLADEHVITRE